MNSFDIYQDISKRTDNALFVGVVGPVRTGKSTFISKMMELLVLPNFEDSPEKTRMVDELPQSGSGKTIMTTQPKFVPSKAVNLKLNDTIGFDVRFVDCVGYMINGALGADDEDIPRMVKTPWSETEIPFEKAAEIGTQKVISEHSTIGILITTDGSIAGIDRENYVSAEQRAVNELKSLGKPFVIVLNSTHPKSKSALELKIKLQEEYQVNVISADVKNLSIDELNSIMESVLYEFPLKQVNFEIPGWLIGTGEDHWLLTRFIDCIRDVSENMMRVRDFESALLEISKLGDAQPYLQDISMDSGVLNIDMNVDRRLFYEILGENCGEKIEDDAHLMLMIKELVYAKHEYDRVADALKSVRETGYGLVAPTQDELTLDEPELVKQGNRFGVRLRASGPSLHMIRVDIDSVITPIIGAEQESTQLINFMLDRFENEPQKLWETEMFGKSLNDLIKEGLSTKLMCMPEDARGKIQATLQKIINNGSGSLICILL
ncbi:MAG: stage IV sporulation protein A [Clostridia bacterium]|nr:stage IV sporulation protein A [Clostridia bacterium]